MAKAGRAARKRRREGRPPREAQGVPPVAPNSPAVRTTTSMRRDPLLHALLQNGWIVVGVFALGWSASVTLGSIYLQTLFCTLALQRAIRRTGRAYRPTGGSTFENDVTRPEALGEFTKLTTLIGLAQGVFVLVFGLGLLRGPEGLDPIWHLSLDELGPAALGAFVTAVIEYARLRRRIPRASDAWLRWRVDLQRSTTFALVLFMMVLPWSFFLVGERGLFVVLIGGKTALDVWLAGRRLPGSRAWYVFGPPQRSRDRIG